MKDALKIANWTGNKTRILDNIVEHFPDACARYIEPFAGSHVVTLRAIQHMHPSAIYVNDKCRWLMYFSEFLHADSRRVIRAVDDICKKFRPHTKQGYYRLRDRFNSGEYSAYLSTAMFFVLSQTCINNLVRFGKQGKFNQGFGNRHVNMAMLESASSVWNRSITPFVHFFSTDAFAFLANMRCRKGDAVYLDPPYLVDHAGYVEWTERDTKSLYGWATIMQSRGAKVILSDCESILFQNGEQRVNPYVAKLAAQGFAKYDVNVRYSTRPGKPKKREYHEVLLVGG